MSEADPDMIAQASGTQQDRIVGDEIDGVGKQYFDNVAIDNIMDAILELSAHVWVSRDRQMVLEAVLTDVLKEQGKDIDLDALVEGYAPSEALKNKRKDARAEFVSDVFRSFSRRPI